MAYDGEKVYAANNMTTDSTADGIDPGLFALDVDNGSIAWEYHHSGLFGGRRDYLPSCARNWGMSAATLLIDGAVVQGANDGFVKVFDSGQR